MSIYHQDHPEKWLPIPGYEGHYEVSNRGRVRSLDRISAQGRPIKGRLLALIAGHNGYLRVNLHRDRKQTTHHVHRLVLDTFTGPAPDEGMEVRHLNGSQSDNTLSNLSWGTHLDNMRDRREHGTHKNSVKTTCPAGHPYQGDNLMVDKKGHRRCATCRREQWRQVNARRSAERKAA